MEIIKLGKRRVKIIANIIEHLLVVKMKVARAINKND